MTAPEPTNETELVGAEDGNIPADQVAGALPDFPDIDWGDFERASELAREDITPS
jgi:hypothetical protein